ncbi:hypothetical protein HJ044_23790 [Vibrio parahaemolyticus]|nr:hypothetical protein [Vibrio parahaemolyticus]
MRKRTIRLFIAILSAILFSGCASKGEVSALSGSLQSQGHEYLELSDEFKYFSLKHQELSNDISKLELYDAKSSKQYKDLLAQREQNEKRLVDVFSRLETLEEKNGINEEWKKDITKMLNKYDIRWVEEQSRRRKILIEHNKEWEEIENE